MPKFLCLPVGGFLFKSGCGIKLMVMKCYLKFRDIWVRLDDLFIVSEDTER